MARGDWEAMTEEVGDAVEIGVSKEGTGGRDEEGGAWPMVCTAAEEGVSIEAARRQSKSTEVRPLVQ